MARASPRSSTTTNCPSVAAADAPAAAEGATAAFNISLNAPSGRDVSVAFATSDGSAIAGHDYTPRSGTIAIPAGATSVSIGVPTVADGADEADETFELRLAFSSSATLRRARAAAVIVDADGPPASGPAPSSGGGEPETPPVGAPARPPAAAPAVPAAITPQLGLSSPRLRRPSIILVTVSCPRQASSCKGRVTIFSRPNLRSKIKALRRERRLGQRNFTLAAGASRTLTMALSRLDRVLLNRTGRMLVRAYAVTTDGAGRSGVRRTAGTLIARTTHS